MKKIAIIGGGNWGSTIAKLVAENNSRHQKFYRKIYMWIYEEKYENRNLSEYINEEHHNPIYLPGIKLPSSVVAVGNFDKIHNCDIFLICLPHQFIKSTLEGLQIKKTACVINFRKRIYI